MHRLSALAALIAFWAGAWLGVGLSRASRSCFTAGSADRFSAGGMPRARLRSVALISSFRLDFVRAFAIRASRGSRRIPALVAQGIGLWIGVQAIINMGVTWGYCQPRA